MLANTIITRLTPALLTVCVVFALGNVPGASPRAPATTCPQADAPIIDYQNRYQPGLRPRRDDREPREAGRRDRP
jgi:hypothetical protein